MLLTNLLLIFVIERIASTKKTIEKPIAKAIVGNMQCHPYYVQQLAHLVWVNTGKVAKQEQLEKATWDLLHQNSLLFQRDFDLLSNHQIRLVKAMAKETGKSYTNKEIINKYQLESSAAVVRSTKALEKKDIIDTFEGRPEFVDPGFKLWLNKIVWQ